MEAPYKKLTLIGQAVSEEKMFKECWRRWTDNGACLYYKLTNEPKGSDELITKYINWQQFTKGTRGKPNEQLFPRQVVIQLPKIY